MRIIHTSDWHLGRAFFGLSLIPDQHHLLEQLFALLVDRRPDVLIIAGDVYDRAIPPTDAVRLLDELLTRIAQELRIPVLLIAGNHDGPDRLAFGARLLEARRIFVRGALTRLDEPVILEDAHGPVAFYLLPYLEPELVRAQVGDASLRGHEAVTALVLERVRQDAASRGIARTVVIAHAFVTGGRSSESERPLAVGGAGTVDAGLFSSFTYTALGHLHRPQNLHPEGRVHYSGSLMKYSFDEADHKKQVSSIEIDARGVVRIEPIALCPLRDVARIEGTFQDMLEAHRFSEASGSYVEATLTDAGYIPDPMTRLRVRFPNLLNVRRLALELALDMDVGARKRLEHDELALFDEFFRAVRGDAPDEARRQVFQAYVEQVRHEERNQ